MSSFFDGFDLTTHDVPGGTVRLRIGGSGPPLLLLHGNPQTHAMWHAVAPAMARRFTVVCPDLRGYGGSFKPPATPDHAPYAKQAMAADLAALMTGLGFPAFRVGAHDRGARVAHRLALDNPGRVEKLAVMDIVPTVEHFERADMSFALGYYHWFWFAQPHPFPEELINKAPDTWFRAHTSRDGGPPAFFKDEALADYLAAARNPDAIMGMCEDYRAAAGVDLIHDRMSRAEGRRIGCPLLVLWGAKGYVGGWYDPLAVWRDYCDGPVTGGPVPSGHYLAEEAPGAVLDRFEAFF
ncbi:MAG: alpha/beta hydrolase [Pseudomonadota bacterium]|nr:alpha/beta hydrolase [Pseudomonadota bacterium]